MSEGQVACIKTLRTLKDELFDSWWADGAVNCMDAMDALEDRKRVWVRVTIGSELGSVDCMEAIDALEEEKGWD